MEDKFMKNQINWGIMATGWIAHKFVSDLKLLEDANLTAVGSRDEASAREFASQYGFKKAYGSYEALVADPDVDVIYIATPHPMHHDNALLCLKAGKAVLCEKPFCMNVRETKEVIDYARKADIFLMEAMWTRYIPAIAKVREWIDSGRIGEVLCLKADFGYRSELNPESRLFNPALGGGALLDVGIYPVSFASMIFKSQPQSVHTAAAIGQTGVDEQFGALFTYEGGKMANLMGALRTDMGADAWILGSEGKIFIPDFFYAKEATLLVKGKEPEHLVTKAEGTGYQYEAIEVMRCLREGLKESPLMSLDETLAIMVTMDGIRKMWGLKYPQED
jgi:dihydrodiol dehydrogenase / D-xylose 1-dehydrogenase (NADP)